MSRFGFRYGFPTAPVAWGLGLVPPLTYLDVGDDRIRLRLGPWFSLEAPRDAVAAADVARGELGLAPSVDVTADHGIARLQVRTGKGPLVRLTFDEPQEGRLLLGPPQLRPRFAPLVIGQPVRVTHLALSLAEPSRAVAELA